MDTKKLRQKILDLAIRGKLVPQDPNDEPASVLLERIRAEKEQLIKEGKIKRSKKSAATDKSHYENVPFEIPKSWCWTTLGEVFTLQAGKNITAKGISDKQDTTYPFPCYGGNGLRGYVSSYNRTGRFPLIGRQGALCGNINVADGLFYATEHAVVVESYCNIDVDWAVYALIYLNLNQYATSTAQPGLSVATINEVLLPVPPIEEQKRIANEIEKWFDLIKEIESGKVELKSYIKQTKSKILDLAISGKLVPQDPNDEPTIELLKRINLDFQPCDNSHYENLPQGWTIVGLHSVAEIITGSTPSKLNAEYYNGDVPFYKPNDLDQGRHVRCASEYLSQQGKSISRSIPCNSIAVCCIGSIGKCGFIEKEGVTNQQINTIVPNDAIFPLYMYYFCNSSTFIDELKSLSSAVTISIVNKSKLSTIQIPLPPIAEQKRIISVIEKLYSHLDMITAEL